jgi:hypothetical protein
VLEWEERVAREVERQARIEAAFDRADACERLGEFERALQWLHRADALSGGLSPSQLAQRSRLANAAHRARRRLAISRPAPTIRVRERETDH